MVITLRDPGGGFRCVWHYLRSSAIICIYTITRGLTEPTSLTLDSGGDYPKPIIPTTWHLHACATDSAGAVGCDDKDLVLPVGKPGGAYTGRLLIDGTIYTTSEATKKFLTPKTAK